jgi:hypothetical protein
MPFPLQNDHYHVIAHVSYVGNPYTRLAEKLMTGKDPEAKVDWYIHDIPTMAIIPDPGMDRDAWSIGNKPFHHIRMGMHVWEEFRAEKGPLEVRRIFEILMRKR